VPNTFAESTVEEAALEWLAGLGDGVAFGPDIAPGTPRSERADYGHVVLEDRLRQALARLNPELPAEAREDAFRKLTRPEGPSTEVSNRAFHRLLVDGVTVEYRRPNGSIAGAQAKVLEFDAAARNDWLALNQLTVVENKHTRRPDVVLFVNGLPLVIIELKNTAAENATIWTAFAQLQTDKSDFPPLCTPACVSGMAWRPKKNLRAPRVCYVRVILRIPRLQSWGGCQRGNAVTTPPSTGSMAPVVLLARREARKSRAAAMSSGSMFTPRMVRLR